MKMRIMMIGEEDDRDAADDEKASHAYTITHIALYMLYI